MIKICLEAWDKYKNVLEDWYRDMGENKRNHLGYLDIVKSTLNLVNYCGGGPVSPLLDIENITEINDGDYQGTLIYLIPFDTYQPSCGEYLMTYIEYGSCSCCDTLQSIQYDDDEERTIKGFMTLSKDILSNTIKPYNCGWRNDERFDTVKKEEKEND